MTPTLLDAIESGNVQVQQVGFSFVLVFRGWIDNCDCPTCTETKAAFDFLYDHVQPEPAEVAE